MAIWRLSRSISTLELIAFASYRVEFAESLVPLLVIGSSLGKRQLEGCGQAVKLSDNGIGSLSYRCIPFRDCDVPLP
jgi:hypothetical protein